MSVSIVPAYEYEWVTYHPCQLVSLRTLRNT
jgi:hypothetical protein